MVDVKEALSNVATIVAEEVGGPLRKPLPLAIAGILADLRLIGQDAGLDWDDVFELAKELWAADDERLTLGARKPRVSANGVKE